MEKNLTPCTEAIWFIYDGECPLCWMGATHFRIRQAVGELHLLNARENPEHPLMQEVTRRGLNLDEGMVLVYGGNFYHGAEALHMMAMLGSTNGWFNRINARLFKCRHLARLSYPAFRCTRNLLLKCKGVGEIGNLEDKP